MRDNDLNATIYFWDGVLFSPGVVLVEAGANLKEHLRTFILYLMEDEDWTVHDSPSNIATQLVIYSAMEADKVGRVTLKNTPWTPSTGGTMTALHQIQVGGAGCLLINLVSGEFQQWGGYGVFPKEGFNARQVVTHPVDILTEKPQQEELPILAIPVPSKKKKKGAKKSVVSNASN